MLVPNGAVIGPITVQTPFGKVSSSDNFRVHPNGYRFLNGFSFFNQTEDEKHPHTGFPPLFAWQRFEETFGMDEMWLVVFDQPILPSPIATNFYSFVHFLAIVSQINNFQLTTASIQQ